MCKRWCICVEVVVWVLWDAECILFGFHYDQTIFPLSSLAKTTLTEGVGWKSSSLYVGFMFVVIEFVRP